MLLRYLDTRGHVETTKSREKPSFPPFGDKLTSPRFGQKNIVFYINYVKNILQTESTCV